jgi:hypothetical protein
MATLAQARYWRDNANLSPNDLKVVDAEIAEKVAEGLTTAAEYRARAVAVVTEVGTIGFDRSGEARDEAQALAESIRSGHVQANEASKALERLTAKIGLAADARARFESAAESVAEIDADPEAWVDRLYERFPVIQPHFTFLNNY